MRASTSRRLAASGGALRRRAGGGAGRQPVSAAAQSPQRPLAQRARTATSRAAARSPAAPAAPARCPASCGAPARERRRACGRCAARAALPRLRMPAVSRAASAPRRNLASRSCRSMETSRSRCCASASSLAHSVSFGDGAPLHAAANHEEAEATAMAGGPPALHTRRVAAPGCTAAARRREQPRQPRGAVRPAASLEGRRPATACRPPRLAARRRLRDGGGARATAAFRRAARQDGGAATGRVARAQPAAVERGALRQPAERRQRAARAGRSGAAQRRGHRRRAGRRRGGWRARHGGAMARGAAGGAHRA
jgi:translation initiation factor IF-2